MRKLFLPLLLLATTVSAQPLEGDALYRVTSVRATPGEFSALIDSWKGKIAEWDGADRPMWMRHSQGDQWDLLFFFPVTEELALAPVELSQDPRVARIEDLYAAGPPVEVLRPAVEAAGFFHVEMFRALPGKRQELIEQRRMENRYLEGIERPQNYIFTRVAGIAVDAFTLGLYRDIQHFAESAEIPFEAEEEAALAAGFDGVMGISPYLRSLIADHHDTLAVAIR